MDYWRKDGNPLQYSCLENSKDRGAWQAQVHGVTELDMTEHSRAENSVARSSTQDVSVFFPLQYQIACECKPICELL